MKEFKVGTFVHCVVSCVFAAQGEKALVWQEHPEDEVCLLFNHPHYNCITDDNLIPVCMFDPEDFEEVNQ